MNFIDYCIATKNYSALNTISEYSKMFTDAAGLIIKHLPDDIAMPATGGLIGLATSALIADKINKRRKKLGKKQLTDGQIAAILGGSTVAGGVAPHVLIKSLTDNDDD